MKKLEDYKDEIYKCSRCGLCQHVCPLWKLFKNESIITRGKFSLLNAILNEEIEVDEKMVKYFDLCLQCNACKDFCPSDINAREIIQALKARFKEKYKKIQPETFFELKLKILRVIILFYRMTKLDFILKKLTFFGKLNNILEITIKRQKNNQKENSDIVYFEGCVNKYINPSTKNASLNILSRLNIKPTQKNFKCCGLPNLSSGDIETFEKNMRFNLSKINENVEYILFDCESCKFAFEKFIKDCIEYKWLEDKLLTVTEFLSSDIQKSNKSKREIKVTYHKPCHAKNKLAAETILRNIENVDYIQIEYSCCGAGGTFLMRHPVISKKLSENRISEILEKEDFDYIITDCPSCKIGLENGIRNNKKRPKILSLSEFLEEIKN